MPLRQRLSFFCALALLLLLALRLTVVEDLKESFTALAMGVELRRIGPPVTLAFTLVTLLLAALAAWLHPLRRRDLLHFALILAILALALLSACRAADRFSALIGACDFAMALLSGWTAILLLNTPSRRRLLLCLLLALGTVWSIRALHQYFVEIPETLEFYQQNREKILQNNGWQEGGPEMRLFESRINSREATGFHNLANVFAAQMIPILLLLAGFLALGLRTLLAAPPSPAAAPPPFTGRRRSQPLPYASPSPPAPASSLGGLLAIHFLIFAAAAFSLFLTDSNGGMAAALLTLLLFLGLFLLSPWTARHRRLLVATGLTLALLGGAALLAYGLAHHRLPTTSLLFRWQYWTGAHRLIAEHPALGIGLNNFGSYYLQTKLPEAPEDVSDPHSFFVRIAAEAGLPAAVLTAALLLWLVLKPLLASSPLPADADHADQPLLDRWALTIPAAILFAAAWFALRFLLAESFLTYPLLFHAIYAIAAAAAMLLGLATLQLLPTIRPLLLALLAGAVGMFLYDQINMALVTGPAAMLFWCLLAAAQPLDAAAPAPRHEASAETPPQILTRSAGRPIALMLLAAAGALGIGVLWPLSQNRFPWDPAPARAAAGQAMAEGRFGDALKALDAGLVCDPRSLQLLRARIEIHTRLGRSTRNDIRLALRLAPADARLHLELGLMPSDLPADERIAALRRALALDEVLAPGEPKHLLPAQRAAAETALHTLSSAGSPPAS